MEIFRFVTASFDAGFSKRGSSLWQKADLMLILVNLHGTLRIHSLMLCCLAWKRYWLLFGEKKREAWHIILVREQMKAICAFYEIMVLQEKREHPE